MIRSHGYFDESQRAEGSFPLKRFKPENYVAVGKDPYLYIWSANGTANRKATPLFEGRRWKVTEIPPVASSLLHSIQKVLRFLSQKLGRNSLDGDGGPILASIDCSETDNVLWDGKAQMLVIGHSADAVKMAAEPEVVAHECFHAVVQLIGGLDARGESSALHEATIDLLTVMFKQSLAVESDPLVPCKISSDRHWLIGEWLHRDPRSYLGFSLCQAIRSVKDPSMPQRTLAGEWRSRPAHMSQYTEHLDNSGIPSRAFYVAWNLLRDSKEYPWEAGQIGPIWMKVLAELKNPSADFQIFANKIVEVCQRENPGATERVRQAWLSVGVQCLAWQ